VLLKGTNQNCLDTQTASYTDSGQLFEAVSNGESVLEMARTGGNQALPDKIEARLASYRAWRVERRGPRYR